MRPGAHPGAPVPSPGTDLVPPGGGQPYDWAAPAVGEPWDSPPERPRRPRGPLIAMAVIIWRTPPAMPSRPTSTTANSDHVGTTNR